MRVDCLQVPALGDALGCHLLAALRAAGAFGEVLLQFDVRVVGEQLRGRLHVAARKSIPSAEEAGKLFEDTLGARDVVRGPFDHDIVAARLDPHAEGALEIAKVFVERTEESLDTRVGHRDASHRGG